jgi:hypothetical protein
MEKFSVKTSTPSQTGAQHPAHAKVNDPIKSDTNAAIRKG